MKQVLPSSIPAVVIAALLALPMAQVSMAQTPAPAPAATPLPDATPPAAKGRPDKAGQNIRTEDAGTRIDEVRVGGETQSITVQPKTGNKLPAYEVKPSDTTKGSLPPTTSGDTNGARVWNVLKF